ncbi:hypothetical protein Nepgr_017412 [Nepenthes gracilis]|uniref:Uncharacterized protein n=1 Tax=Nepenthes gracilis TaxID=150966 RepID=A0AAD3XTB9_NEPGR|nr:hypothetical protein Nepgr_017412 [Nepenthes gracilis]
MLPTNPLPKAPGLDVDGGGCSSIKPIPVQDVSIDAGSSVRNADPSSVCGISALDQQACSPTTDDCLARSVGDVYENEEALSGSVKDMLADVASNTEHPELDEGAQHGADHAAGSNGVPSEFPEVCSSPLPGSSVQGYEDLMAGAVMPCILERGLVHTLPISPPQQEHCDLVAIRQEAALDLCSGDFLLPILSCAGSLCCSSWLLFPILLLTEDNHLVLLKRPMVGL